MGTRSLTYVHDSYKDDKGETVTFPLVCMYRQYDGYPSGHGKELAEFLTPFSVGNGISGSPKFGEYANGMSCLAAQMVAHFKTEVGGIYLHQPKLDQDCWQDYEYHVYDNYIVVKNPTEVIFNGDWKEFFEFCSEEEIV